MLALKNFKKTYIMEFKNKLSSLPQIFLSLKFKLKLLLRLKFNIQKICFQVLDYRIDLPSPPIHNIKMKSDSSPLIGDIIPLPLDCVTSSPFPLIVLHNPPSP